MGEFTHFLAARGFRPRTIIDVGVADGTMDLYGPFPAARLLLVEPMREFRSAITSILARYGGHSFEVAAGAETGELAITFHDGVAAAHNAAFTGDVEPGRHVRMVPIRRIDDLVDEAHMPGPYLLKIDVEGFEREVLKGAGGILADTDVIILETAFYRFDGARPIFHEVVADMAARGYVVFDMFDGWRRPLDQSLALYDVAFVRQDSALRGARQFAAPGKAGASARALSWLREAVGV
jgi:FkbM family methyltransferase